jgi:hypothetical protein
MAISFEPEKNNELDEYRTEPDGKVALDERDEFVEDAPRPLPPRKANFGDLRYYLTLEIGLYGLILLVALVTRFINLDFRTLHHDEGVHAWYSWRLFNGEGYVQEPWKHGPFLYHIQAAVFWIFSDSNTTARVSTAIFGVLMCFLPLTLRKELGRWGTLTLSFLLLISPMFLYYSRFLREDIFVAFSTFLFFAGIVRFVDRPRALWWHVTMVALAFLICTKAVSFFYIAIFGGFVIAWLCWQLAPRLLLILGGYLLAALWLFFFVMGLYPPPAIPYEKISGQALSAYIGSLVTHPIFWTFWILLGLGVAVAGFAVHEVAANRRKFMVSRGWAEPDTPLLSALFAPYRQSGTVAYAFSWLGQHWRTTLLGIGLGVAFYFVLYTGFFTDIPVGSVGIFSGLWYWMAQQGVARGNQPWFYYLFMLPLYEPLALMFGTIASGFIGYKAFRYGFRRQRRTVLVETTQAAADSETDNDSELDDPTLSKDSLKNQQSLQEVEIAIRPAGNALWPGRRRRERHPYFMPLFALTWAWGSLFIYSWASEKMPWLTVQVALPFIVLAAWFMDGVWEGIEDYFRRGDHREPLMWGLTGRFFVTTLFGGLIAVGFMFYMLMLHLSSAQAGVAIGAVNYNWILVWIPPAMAILLFTAFFSFMGWGVALRVAGAAVFGLLCIYLTYTATTFAYNSGDVALEPGVYTQTHPDVYRVTKEIDTVTLMLPEQRRTPIVFDTNLRTPLDFYFREYKFRQRVENFANPVSEAGVPISLNDYPLVLISEEKLGTLSEQNKRALAENFIARDYMFHNWVEESLYRDFDRAAEKQIAFLQDKPSQAAVKDATNKVVLERNETMTVEKLQQLSGMPGVLDKVYNANGGNSTLLHAQEAGRSLNKLRTPAEFSRLWRYVMFREMPLPLGRREFTLYIKKDIAPIYRQYADLVPFPISRPR